MRRRLLVAQAIVHEPVALLMDEPTEGLDPEQRVRFKELVGSLAGSCAVLISSHELGELVPLCDHVLMLDAGRIRFDGPTEEFREIGRRSLGDGSGLPEVEAAFLQLRAQRPVES